MEALVDRVQVVRVRDVPRGKSQVVLYARGVLCPGCGGEKLQRVVRWYRRAGQAWRVMVCAGCGHGWDEWEEWSWVLEGAGETPAVQDGEVVVQGGEVGQLALFGMEG